MLLLGAAHAQAERIAATEPETQAAVARALSPFKVVKTAAGAARALASAFLPARASLPAAGGSSSGRPVDFGKDGDEPTATRTKSDELDLEIRRKELADFDARMRERDARRRGGQ